jgi:hypothetical protein
VEKDLERWAAAHYRVERESSGIVMRKRVRRKATELAIQFGDPVPDEPHDVVRIYDRAGVVVFEQDWATNRAGALEQEARIIDDLLKLDVLSFRGRYGISAETAAAPPRRTRAVGGGTRKSSKKSPARSRKSPASKASPKKGATGRRKRGSG